MLKKLDAGEKFPPSYPYPVHAWRLGKEMLVIGMGAETVVDYALRFKREFGPGTWVCGYADDMIAYIPSRRVWEEGGYEGGSNLYEYGRPALRWAGDIEDRIAATVHKLVRQVRDTARSRGTSARKKHLRRASHEAVRATLESQVAVPEREVSLESARTSSVPPASTGS